jgi:hypothetical protein
MLSDAKQFRASCLKKRGNRAPDEVVADMLVLRCTTTVVPYAPSEDGVQDSLSSQQNMKDDREDEGGEDESF